MKRNATVLLILICGLSLAACGSSKKAASTTSTTAGGANSSFATAYAAYRSCMASNGVTLPANSGFGGRRGGGTGSAGGTGTGEGAPTDGGNNNNGAPPAGAGAPPAGAGAPPAGAGAPPVGTGTRPSTTLPAGVTQAQYDKAQTACASKLPTGRGRSGGANATQFAAYISCLKDNGVAITGTGAQALAGLDRTTATFAAAQAKCAALMPQRNTTSTTTPTTV